MDINTILLGIIVAILGIFGLQKKAVAGITIPSIHKDEPKPIKQPIILPDPKSDPESFPEIEWTYLGITGSMPSMSIELWEILQSYINTFNVSSIDHLGTVGDARHLRESPGSFHNHIPPDAIDIAGINYDSFALSPDDKVIVGKRFKNLGATVYHMTDGHKHIHVQTPS